MEIRGKITGICTSVDTGTPKRNIHRGRNPIGKLTAVSQTPSLQKDCEEKNDN